MERAQIIFVRVIYLMILLALAYYATRLPIFIAGSHSQQIVPGVPIFRENMISNIFGLIWVFKNIKFKMRFWIWLAIVGGTLSLMATLLYMRSQPADARDFLSYFATFYFYATSLVLMPLMVTIGCNLSPRFGPKLFKQWQGAL